MTDSASVTVYCSNCRARLTWTDETVDVDRIICQQCGEDAGTYGDLVEAAKAAVAEKYIAAIKKAFDRR